MHRITPSTNAINRFLQSEAATLSLLTMALAAQLPHAAAVFRRLSTDIGTVAWIHAYSYAFALEFATLAFVVRGKVKWAWGFAGVSIAVNLAYYQVWQSAMVAPFIALQVLLVSFALPVAIAMYSHDVARRQETQPAKTPQKRPTVSSNAKTPEAQTSSPAPQGHAPDKLKLGKAAIIRQHHSQGMDAQEIANVTGYNLAYIRQTISRATQQNGDGNG